MISGRVIQPGPRTPARITGGPRHRARTATKIRIPVLWLYPWGLLKWPQMTRFTHWSCYYDIRDGATHLGQNENESRVKRICQKIQLFFSNRQKLVREDVGEVVKSYIWAELKAEHEFEV